MDGKLLARESCSYVLWPRGTSGRSNIVLMGLVLGIMLTQMSTSFAEDTLPQYDEVMLERTIHFLDMDGQDVSIGPGAFNVTPGEKSIRLQSQDPKEGIHSIVIAANAEVQKKNVDSPMTFLMHGEDPDQVFLILNTPEGKLLEAMGTFSGVRPRDGVRFLCGITGGGRVGIKLRKSCKCSFGFAGVIGDTDRTKFVSWWQKGTGKSALWRHFAYGPFWDKVQEMWRKGFKLIDIETYKNAKGKRLWAGVFLGQKVGGQYLYRGASESAFLTKHDELVGRGYRLIDLEIYKDKIGDKCYTPPKFAGVWQKGTGKQDVDLLLGKNEFYKRYVAQNAQGLRLIDIERDEIEGVAKWSGVWEEGTGGKAMWRNFDEATFKKKVDEMRKQRLRLIDVEFYKTKNGWRWAGIFRPGNYKEFLWQWEGDLKSFTTSQRNQWNNYKKQGSRMIDLEVKGWYTGRE